MRQLLRVRRIVRSFLTPLAMVLAACGGKSTPPTPPTISAQPQSITVADGAAASFSVTATGNGTLSYQWSKDGTNIAGATAATYSIAAAHAADGGLYVIVLSAGGASTTSSAATLAVNVAPTITTQPASLTRAPGTAASFTVTATGSGTLSYRWRQGGANISGATAATFSIASVASGDAGSYDVIVTNSLGATATQTTSFAATLTVGAVGGNIAITTQPQSQTAAVGADITFTGAATGPGTLHYDWKKGGISLGATDRALLELNPVASGDAGSYTVVVSSNQSGVTAVTSDAAILTVTTPTFNLNIGSVSSWCHVTAKVSGTTVADFDSSSASISPAQPPGTSIALSAAPHSGFITAKWKSNANLTATGNSNGDATYVMSSGASQSITVCCPFPDGSGCGF